MHPISLTDITLRQWAEGDQPDLIAQANNKNVWRNLSHLFPHPYTREDADNWIMIANADTKSIHLAIEYQGKVIGGIGAVAGEGVFAATVEIGYWLGEDFWGKGFASQALTALTDHLITQQTFVRLQATVFAWNEASMHLLEKAGYAREACLQKSISKDGQLIDSFIYVRFI